MVRWITDVLLQILSIFTCSFSPAAAVLCCNGNVIKNLIDPLCCSHPDPGVCIMLNFAIVT